ncbi:TetR/AcrR family transcriptional regulator [Kribbella albertanoniae]|uniref:TetR/AcrR family transcriptional regulator n=1 Tax=Kribbella albertanoniae TaxID=1266829 RepID=A0A4R4Q099_9ACTN|nr:TetR/AcrR family transcriptional regulator [Kribbella albertanoniae]TDC28336.1 TetR/AcrR family transcriptional regulator [Kribbella albertanoniae]
MNRTPRERMVYSAAQLIRARGPAGIGVREIVEHADAPRGSFQHYFPGGKGQLVGEAVLWAGDFAAQWAARYPETTRHPTPSGLFAHMVKPWKDEFAKRGYERGCPVMASVADLGGTDDPLTTQIRTALDHWEQAVTQELIRMGIPRGRSRRLAVLMISTLEGAIMFARLRQDSTPLTTAVTTLAPALIP